MEQCVSCGAAMAPDLAWCGQCYMPRGSAPAVVPPPASALGGAATSTGGFSVMAGTRPQSTPLPMVKTRWRKTPTTFGPAGRVLCTVLLLLPLPLFIVGTVVAGVGIIGLGIWVLLIMPWALRDIWKAGQLPAG